MQNKLLKFYEYFIDNTARMLRLLDNISYNLDIPRKDFCDIIINGYNIVFENTENIELESKINNFKTIKKDLNQIHTTYNSNITYINILNIVNELYLYFEYLIDRKKILKIIQEGYLETISTYNQETLDAIKDAKECLKRLKFNKYN